MDLGEKKKEVIETDKQRDLAGLKFNLNPRAFPKKKGVVSRIETGEDLVGGIRKKVGEVA